MALHQVSGLFPWVYTLVFYCVCHCGATSGIGTFSMSLYLGILLRVPLWRYIRYRDFFHESISWYSIACAIVALHQVSGLFPWVYTLVFYCVCHCGATSGIGTFSMSLYLGILLRVPLWRYIRYRDFFSRVNTSVFYCVCHCGATSGIGTFSMSIYLGILLRVPLWRYIRYRDFFHESISWYSTACAIVALHQV